MKKKLMMLAIALLSVVSLSASDKEKSSGGASICTFGIKGGVNVSSLGDFSNSSLSYYFSSNVGFSAGIVTSFALPVQGMTIQPELYYLSGGYKTPYGKNSIGYLHLPVNLQVGLDLILLRPFVMVSPYIGYALHESDEFSRDKYSRFDYGIGVGGGIDFWKFQVQVKYNWSFAKCVPIELMYDEGMTKGEASSKDSNGSTRNLEISLVFFF